MKFVGKNNHLVPETWRCEDCGASKHEANFTVKVKEIKNYVHKKCNYCRALKRVSSIVIEPIESKRKRRSAFSKAFNERIRELY